MINHKLIKQKMKEQGLTYRELGDKMRPKMTPWAMWFQVNRAGSIKILKRLGAVLGADWKEFLK